MPPVDALDATERPFRVHLTGFGPFRDIKENPSWLAVRALDGETLSEPPPPLSEHTPAATPSASSTPMRGHRPVHLSCSLLPVEYSAVEQLAPRLQLASPGRPPPDLIVHVGVSAGDSAIRLEQRARKFGYNSLDAAGRHAPGHDGTEAQEASVSSARRGFVDSDWETAPDELRTRVDADTVIRWAKSHGLAFLSPSEDAGLYLCEFSYFASMAAARQHNPVAPTPVQFIHVPPVGNPYSATELTAAICLLVWAIAGQFTDNSDNV
ncbi:hypothetical protein JCM3774_006819 [Rhodotorula dairenensis]